MIFTDTVDSLTANNSKTKTRPACLSRTDGEKEMKDPGLTHYEEWTEEDPYRLAIDKIPSVMLDSTRSGSYLTINLSDGQGQCKLKLTDIRDEATRNTFLRWAGEVFALDRKRIQDQRQRNPTGDDTEQLERK